MKAKGDARALFPGPASAAGEPTDEPGMFRGLAEDGQVCATRFQDLSEEDQLQVRKLNMIELASLLDRDETVRPVQKKSKRKKRKGNLGIEEVLGVF